MAVKISPSTIKSRLASLRSEMSKRNIDAYIITSDDNHASEYVGSSFMFREYMSGFTGSHGTLVVTKDNAALWTDGRYFLQAAEQLDGTGIDLMKSDMPGVPSIEDYLHSSVPAGGKIGFNGLTVSTAFAKSIEDRLKGKNTSVKFDEDLADIVWSDRPGMSAEPVWELPVPDEMSRHEKLKSVRKKMADRNCDLLVLAALDEIAWLLNLRGNDIHCCPVFLSFMAVTQNKAVLFINESVLSDEIRQKLLSDGICFLPYGAVASYLRENCSGIKAWADEKKTNYCLMKALSDSESVDTSQSPVEILKAVKTPYEQQCVRQAHLRDGVALTKFIYWLKTNVGREKITELDASDKLLSLRKQQDKFFEPSFDSIVGYGEHGAVIHYEPTEESNVEIKPTGFCLVDSGGQYYDGTTDVTRTISLGKITNEMKLNYTLVLKGHLALGNIHFKKGCSGGVLDTLARAYLWNNNLDYLHGTGHGVGFVLNVHEGPQRISTKGSDQEILPGMIISNEPGLYIEGKYGIRIENLILCRNECENDFGQFLSFETLTLAPYDRDSIDVSALSADEITQINEYHRRVFDSLSAYLDENELLWLKKETAPL